MADKSSFKADIYAAIVKAAAIEGWMGPVPQAQAMALSDLERANVLGYEVLQSQVYEAIKEDVEINQKKSPYAAYRSYVVGYGLR
ncbi:MAG: hypothetical protein ISR44_00520 [Rhodospirillales bacterium]|nr:hypothetical protein [Rhodospirillales bacterium]